MSSISCGALSAPNSIYYENHRDSNIIKMRGKFWIFLSLKKLCIYTTNMYEFFNFLFLLIIYKLCKLLNSMSWFICFCPSWLNFIQLLKLKLLLNAFQNAFEKLQSNYWNPLIFKSWMIGLSEWWRACINFSDVSLSVLGSS